MKLEETFRELSAIYDNSYNITEAFTDRNILIANIKSTGRNYNFDRWSDTQLYRMWQRIQQEEHNKKIARKILTNMERKRNTKYCVDCGTQLSDSGRCHKCDTEFGFEELDEGVFDGLPNTSNWVTMNGTPITKQSTTSQTNSSITDTSLPQSSNNIVTIVFDGNRLRAQADDGQNGKGFVAFPNNLRTKAGQKYKVDKLIWNGKNYRVSGDITPINSTTRYVVANDNILDKYAIQFVHHIDSNKGRTYGLSELEELEDDCFSDTLIDAKTRVRDIMKHWPYSDLYIIEVDENNNLGTIVASYT